MKDVRTDKLLDMLNKTSDKLKEAKGIGFYLIGLLKRLKSEGHVINTPWIYYQFSYSLPKVYQNFTKT